MENLIRVRPSFLQIFRYRNIKPSKTFLCNVAQAKGRVGILIYADCPRQLNNLLINTF
jgi:hypothetical protein